MLKQLLAVLALAFMGQISAQTTVFDVIEQSPDHNTLETAIVAAQLDATLETDGPFTVFAPTDAAFDALPDGLIADLLADPTGRLANILLYHVVGAEAPSGSLSDDQIIPTLQGQDVVVDIVGTDIFINNAQVTVANLPADNGIVHVIDAVLLPEYPATVVDIIVASEVHTTLEAAVGAAGLVDALSGDGPFTVFAPTDDAFAALPAGLVTALLEDPTGRLADILLYHVAGVEASAGGLTDGQMVTTLQGQDVTIAVDVDGNVTVNGVAVTVANLYADNGIVHVIDAVLLPEYPATVVDIIVASEVHTTLEAAVGAAGLVDALSGDGPFTVFAPTDDAFAALPAGLVTALLEDPTGRLADILLYHVAGVEASAGGLTDGQTVTTLQGQDVTIGVDVDGNVTVNGVAVTVANLYADNGIVHVIDAVLLPEYPATVVDIIVASEVHTTLEAAVGAAGLVDALSGDGPFTVFAPTDDAFAALPAGLVTALLEDPTGRLADILLYHVAGVEASAGGLTDGQTITTLQGQDVTIGVDVDGNVTVNGVAVTVANLYADNGIVHVIDAVLLPEYPATVVDIIVASEVHTTLEAAVGAAGLVDALGGDGPFTVFAPTDDAFAALPAGLVTALLEDPTGRLADILLYHVAGVEASAGGLTDGQMVTTLQGQDVTIAVDAEGNVTVNGVAVTVANLYADNGIVHVIDAVLLPEYPATVVDIIVASEVHTTLEAAVGAAGLVDALGGDGPFTVFAPTDDAFAALPAGLVTALLEDPTGRLADILLYHVAGVEASAGGLTDGQMVTTLQGQDVTIAVDAEGNVTVNGVAVTVANLYADNGIVHVIDAVLLPEYPATVVDIIVASEVHNTLETAVTEAGLVGALSGDGPFTVFAPTDDAFAALPEGVLDTLLNDPTGALADVLLYHVVGGEASAGGLSDGQAILTLNGKDVTVRIEGESVFINEAQVTVTNLYADNGIVHVINAVLLPPTTVFDIIRDSEVHNTLQQALELSGLDSVLLRSGTYTVFAPTDDAFAAVDAETLNALLADPEGDLTTVLLYHVLGDSVASTALMDGMMAETLQGESVTIAIDGAEVRVDGALVTTADIRTSNGIVHVIDAVLLPAVVSVQELSESGLALEIYPNPVVDRLVVNLNEPGIRDADLMLYDATGRLVNNWRVAPGQRELSVGQLQPGTYFLLIRIDNQVFHRKIMKY